MTHTEKIIDMCVEYRNDYHIRKLPTDPPWILGMTEYEAKMLYKVMEDMYYNGMLPAVKRMKRKAKKRK